MADDDPLSDNAAHDRLYNRLGLRSCLLA